jgi:protein gp37
MGQGSSIEWTHHTFNPWWGCVKVSPGCKNCYAETFSKRFGYDVWGVNTERKFFGDKYWNEPVKWNKKAKQSGERTSVFCASVTTPTVKRVRSDGGFSSSQMRFLASLAGQPLSLHKQQTTVQSSVLAR